MSNFDFLPEKFIKKVTSLVNAVKTENSRSCWLHNFLNSFTAEYLGDFFVTKM